MQKNPFTAQTNNKDKNVFYAGREDTVHGQFKYFVLKVQKDKVAEFLDQMEKDGYSWCLRDKTTQVPMFNKRPDVWVSK